MRTYTIRLALLILAGQLLWFKGVLIGAEAPPPESPRIKGLESRLTQTGSAEIEAFWGEIAERGAPLVESLPGDERYRLVTFLWRGDNDTKNVFIVGGVTPRWAYSRDGSEQKFMAHLGGADVWYKTYRVRSDARVTYLLSPNDPLVEDKKSPTWRLDPLNPHRFEFKLDPGNPQSANVTPAVSVLSLPDAPAQRWTGMRDHVPHGNVATMKIKSTLLGNERRLWVYTPPGYQRQVRYPLLILFDGWEYLQGIHVNMPATVPPEIAKALQAGDPPPSGLTPEEKAAYEQMNALYTKGSGYALMMVTRPQTLGYSLADSPVGLAAWFYDKFADWTYTGGHPEKELRRDEMLDDITLYWLTNTGTSGARLYWENNANTFNAVDISLPAAMTVFPGEIYQAPRSWG